MRRYLVAVFALLAPLQGSLAAGPDCETNRNTLVPVPGGYEVRFTPGCEPPPLRAQAEGAKDPSQRQTPSFAGGRAPILARVPTAQGAGSPSDDVNTKASDNARDQADESKYRVRPRIRFGRR
jgi:hypothetical protein